MSTTTESGRTSTSCPFRSPPKPIRRRTNTGEIAQQLGVIDDHTVVAHGCLPSCPSRARGVVSDAQVYPRRQWRAPVFGRDAARDGRQRPASRAPRGPGPSRRGRRARRRTGAAGWIAGSPTARSATSWPAMSLEHARAWRTRRATSTCGPASRSASRSRWATAATSRRPCCCWRLSSTRSPTTTDRCSPSSAASSTTGPGDSTTRSPSRSSRGDAAATGDDVAGSRRSRTSARSSPSAASTTRAREHLLRPSRWPSSSGSSAGPPSRWRTWPTSRPSRATSRRRSTPTCRPRTATARPATQADLPRLYADHASALADANLLDDAEHLIDRAVATVRASGNDLEHAELLLVSAEIDLAKGKPAEAHVSAVDAVAAFTCQGRESWLHVAERLRLRAEARLTPDEPGIAEGLVMNGRALAAGGWRSDALSSTLLAALLYVQHGRHDDARTLLAERRPRRGPRARRRQGGARTGRRDARRAGGDRAAARPGRERRAARGRGGAGRARVARGARPGRPPRRRADRARRPAGDRGRAPRELLHRIEAMRTMVWRVAARAGARRRGDGVAADRAPPVRRGSGRSRGRSGGAAGRRPPAPARRARDPDAVAPGPRAAGRVDHDGGGRRRRARPARRARAAGLRQPRRAGCGPSLPAAAARRCTTSATSPRSTSTSRSPPSPSTGSTASRGRTPPRDAARLLLDEAATSLADLLLPATVARSDRPLVVVPTGALHGVPWRALAPLRGRPVSVSPSLSAWSTASQAAAGACRSAGRARRGVRRRPRTPVRRRGGRRRRRALRATRRSCPSAESTAEGVVGLFGVLRPRPPRLPRRRSAWTTHCSRRCPSATARSPCTTWSAPTRCPRSSCSRRAASATSAAINGGTLLGLSSALGAFGASDVDRPADARERRARAGRDATGPRRARRRRHPSSRAGRGRRIGRGARPGRRGVRRDRRLTSLTNR